MVVKVNEAVDEFEVQRERVLEVFGKWRAVLGLKWWTIDFSWEYDTSIFAEETTGYESTAMVEASWPYRHATIYVNILKLHERADEELERCILHELVHIPLFEMQPDQADFVDHRERVVCTLTQAFQWVREEGFEEGRKAGLKEARKRR